MSSRRHAGPDLVVTLMHQVAALEARVAVLEGRHRARDERHRAALLALATSIRGLSFTAKSAIAHATTVDAELLTALRAAGVATPAKLGRWLRTMHGRPVADLRVDRIGKDVDGAIWMFRP